MKQKNILLICTDHWAASFLGCSGHPAVMTPTLDYMAGNGIRFENYYSECPVCIPARRTMMTSLSPRSHGDRVYSGRMEMPNAPTLAQTLRNSGYQTYAVGKLHVYPQRDRIGFDDVILQEEGRYEYGSVDDYQIWLGEHGFTGAEFLHGMGNNTYYTRTWHLPEETHPTTWATLQMMKQIKRRDPRKPSFFYMSYQFPHPPLVPLSVFWDKYKDEEIDAPRYGDWEESEEIFRLFRESESIYSEKEIRMARRAFYAQCTHIDYQIRLLIGTLRECGILDDTVILFTSDHGDMLFDHHMVAKRAFYENSANIPLIVYGKPITDKYGKKGCIQSQLGAHVDLMPTILDICDIPAPDGMEGFSLFSDQTRDYLYGEVGDGIKATRMIHDGRYKMIYYPYGNVTQLFDLLNDPMEKHNLVTEKPDKVNQLTQLLIEELYGEDLLWLKEGKLKGIPVRDENRGKTDYGLVNQRGYHWPAPM